MIVSDLRFYTCPPNSHQLALEDLTILDKASHSYSVCNILPCLLIENARKLIQDFRNAHSELGGDIPSLAETDVEIEQLDKSVTLVQQEEALHNAAVIREIKNTIKGIHSQSWEAVRIAAKKKRAIEKNGPDAMVPKRYFHSFRPMPKWTIRRKNDLDKAILCAQVGVAGNKKDGFMIQPDEVFRMSGKVTDAIGIHLVLALRLWDVPTDIVGRLTSPDKASEEGVHQHGTAVDGAANDMLHNEQDSVYDNITLDWARAMAGDAGVEGWTEAAKLPRPRRKACG
ncbi:hypothetical protein FBEOM_11557 [Fusarium beomiforme]|uniref:Uncharacterized protein n=1 Tax=Fusarium beomiforme TaxID=44412 RepID=A0A9P5A9G7_9HYPO|nr:hypothetical protein FBEOM_11557 [Fusarium beomiforme]